MHTNAHSVLNNLVLLDTICDHSDNAELLCMMRTSRLGFNTAASRVWRDLDSVQPLLMLLTPVLRFSAAEDLEIKLPAFSSEVFTRFNCYNAFVRKLVVSSTWYFDESKSETLPVEMKSWSTLSLRAQHAPLLPNLDDLGFSGSFTNENEVISWITTLISPSVKTLDLRTFMDSLSTTVVLGLLARKAPELKKLFHSLRMVTDRDIHTFIEESAASQLVLSRLDCGHLRSLQRLSHLAIDGQFISSSILLELSRLPKLYFLSINQISWHNENLARTFTDTQLPIESFPSLQSLQLESAVLDDIVAAWNVTPFVSGLTTATIRYMPALFGTGTMYDDSVLQLVLPSMAASSPNIRYLALGIRADKQLSMKLVDSSWTHVERLPLSYLKLEHFEANAASFENVQQIWPRLIVLEIRGQTLTPQHLIYLSQLPMLEKIIAGGFRDMDQVPKTQGPGCSPLQIIQLPWVLDPGMVVSAENVARFLLGLWPQLQEIACEASYHWKRPQRELELLNKHIRVMRG
ncbi:hypothetical protein FRC09_000304 [Ceratobasidium sp. 395]|nr:hypothetical protein FRC09_000304 [Ceratobasidium sp. 395]